MKALHRQMKEKSIKTRQGCFALLTELILVLPGALASHMNLLVPGVQFSLASSQSNSNMKIDTLSFVQVQKFVHDMKSENSKHLYGICVLILRLCSPGTTRQCSTPMQQCLCPLSLPQFLTRFTRSAARPWLFFSS